MKMPTKKVPAITWLFSLALIKWMWYEFRIFNNYYFNYFGGLGSRRVRLVKTDGEKMNTLTTKYGKEV